MLAYLSLQDIVNKTDDITRGTVQKSVCVLTTLVCATKSAYNH